ncbi:hypothetical protein [Bacillus phage vB_BanS-Thrax3]|nr:hypothetical protein [Bacillus phage vB_BanS-Thrax1]UUV46656.1 hypothetical protein [Bacillus phage vB_BanS-Thrax3]
MSKLLNEYEGKTISVTYDNEYEEIIEHDTHFELTGKIKFERRTIIGNVIIHDGIGMLVQKDGTVTYFNEGNNLNLYIQEV